MCMGTAQTGVSAGVRVRVSVALSVRVRVVGGAWALQD